MVLSVILLIVIIGLLLALWKIRKLKQRTVGNDPPTELSTVKNNACTSDQQDNYSEAYEDRSANKGYVNLPPKPPKLPKPRKKSEEVQEEFAYSSCP